MFIPDRPIQSKNDDFLGRIVFSEKLGKSLSSWKDLDSLVVSLYGKWGSGKSSVINLAIEWIENNKINDKPTKIEFNPWFFSDLENLHLQFFLEIARQLEIKNESEKDKSIALKLKIYSEVLNLIPSKPLLKNFTSKLILGFGLLGISTSQIMEWFNISDSWFKYFLFIIGFLIILVEILKGSLNSLSNLFRQKSVLKNKSVLSLKNDIITEISKREKKLLIVIDDIDRLSESEIRQIFQLIRVNADFPNTIYLLAFDREIIEKNLEEQIGISGKDFLEKIVQVHFDIPFTKETKIAKFLFSELDRVLNTLPDSFDRLFDQTYWSNIYHSGFKNFFHNVRDVKRYISSLEFNMSLMYQDESMEVNPIDFIAIEAIRLFAPDFYSFMKSNKILFTETESNYVGVSDNQSGRIQQRKESLDNALNRLDEDTIESIKELLNRLFPQIGTILDGFENVHYGHSFQIEWSKKLRVCSINYFDAYFTLIPGGDDDELSQFELDKILNSSKDSNEFEKLLFEYIENKKIRKVLSRLQDYTGDKEIIHNENIKNIIQALFNISDHIPDEEIGVWDLGPDMEIMRIAYQLLARDNNRNLNYEILSDTCTNSKSLFGPIQKISLESQRGDKQKIDEILVAKGDLIKLQNICLIKIQESADSGKLLDHQKLIYILYRWKEWGDESEVNSFISKLIEADDGLIRFLKHFIYNQKSQTIGDYGYSKTKRLKLEPLKDFLDLELVKERIAKIKNENSPVYDSNKEDLSFIIDNLDKPVEY